MKDAYIQQLLITATALVQSFDMSRALMDVYFDRSYGAGGINEISAGDLAAVGLTPSQIASFITLSQQIQAFRSGAAIVAGDYDVTLNALRRDV